MQASKVLQGASRLPMSSKQGRMNFYKGRGQARVPGAGHRTGAPGKWASKGKPSYLVMDDKVRYYVSPGIETLNNTDLKPYVSTKIRDIAKEDLSGPDIPSFAPNASTSNILAFNPQNKTTVRIKPNDTKAFARWYKTLNHAQKTSVIARTRKAWYEKMATEFAPSDTQSVL